MTSIYRTLIVSAIRTVCIPNATTVTMDLWPVISSVWVYSHSILRMLTDIERSIKFADKFGMTINGGRVGYWIDESSGRRAKSSCNELDASDNSF